MMSLTLGNGAAVRGAEVGMDLPEFERSIDITFMSMYAYK
jgi:hypothetical protein